MQARQIAMVFGLVAAATWGPAAARTAGKPAAVFEALTQCRELTDDHARLACFDQAAAKLDEAEKRHDVVVVDREEIKAARRSLFGLTLPSLNLFAGSGNKAEVVSEIDATVASVGNAGGALYLTLDDGAHWRQIDDTVLPRTPRPGDTIKIKRAALGSYLMYVHGLTMRVKREN